MIDKISKIAGNVKFWEYRYEKSDSNTIIASNNKIKNMIVSENIGHSFRVLTAKGWGFNYSNEMKDIKSLVKGAIKISKVVENNVSLKESPIVKDDVESKYKINPQDVSLEEKRDLVLRNSKIENKLKNVESVYKDELVEKKYYNSLGSEINQNLTYTYCGSSATAFEKGAVENHTKRIGGLCGFELTKDLTKITEEVKKKSISLLSAKVPKGGKFPVIADGILTDVFVHEAVGHACEADLVMNGDSCLEGQVGSQIGTDIISIHDDATMKGLWGSYFYDDEGVKAADTCLVKKGFLNNYLTSRETAEKYNMELSGNARSQNVSMKPIIRMSNTYIEKGKDKFEDMISEIKKGFYLKGSRGGQVDTARGSFQFSCSDGYFIENGELGKEVKGVSLGGTTLETLQNIKMISNKYEPGFPGFCGKNGQSVPVIGNCPSIMIKNAFVGGK